MTTKGLKKSQSSNRAGSALNKEAGSIAPSFGSELRKRMVTIWPEWSDMDINGEKWEVAVKGKEKDKGKSPVQQQHYYDDPEGKLDLPSCLRVDHYKRPLDFIKDKTPVVVDPECYKGFDLLTPNEVCFESELIRWIVGQIIALWKQSELKNPDGTPGIVYIDPSNPALGEYNHSWRPWEHIYAMKKPGKELNVPLFNPHGKYVVKLFWLGAWRKLIVDDSMPCDDLGRCLLPMTSFQNELWPMLLTKALIKVASLDYAGGSPSCEFGDFSVIHCLTSWLPEALPLHEFCRQGHMTDIWNLLQASLPQFKLPEIKPEVDALEGDSNAGAVQTEGQPHEKSDVIKDKDKGVPPEKSDVKKDKKEDKKKEDKKDKGKGEKEKTKEKSMINDDQPLPEHPEVMVFASYSGPPKFPLRMSALRDMADASECLRQKGLSHIYPHPVLLTQTRACPLEPPPPPEIIPAWKLIRPRKKKTTPSDEPVDEAEAVEKPIQSLQITSPFINYKVSPVPIPTEIHRPRSELERGQSRMCSRPGTANVEPIEEGDENAPEPEIEVKEPQAIKVEEPPEEPEPVKEAATQQVTSTKASISKKSLPPQNKLNDKTPSAKGLKVKAATPTTKKQDDTSSTGKKSPNNKLQKRESSVGKGRSETNKSASDRKSQDKDSTPSAKGSKTGDRAEEEKGGSPTHGIEDDHATIEEESPKPDPETQIQDMWIDFDEFCKCFKTLYIYHKWNTYPHNYKNSDLKYVQTGKDHKKTNPNTAMPGGDEKSPYYLFVDSLKPSEIVVNLTSLSRWPEPPPPPMKDEVSKIDLKAGGKTKDKGDKDKDSRAEAMTVDSSSLMETATNQEPKVPEPVQPGLLTAEPYSWKSLVTGQPLLRIRSSGVKSTVLNLPPGRHVLRFNMTAPLGYHYHLCSSTPFVFGDEEKVMAELTKESCRFIENATHIVQTLGKCIHAFNDAELMKTCWEDFINAHCPYRKEKNASLRLHFNVFLEAFYKTVKKFLGESSSPNHDMTYAWRCFFLDAITVNPLGASSQGSRPATGQGAVDRSSAKQKGGKKQTGQTEAHTGKHHQHHGESTDTKLEDWKNREPTVDEHIAVVKIAKHYRGHRVRKIKAGRRSGTTENETAHQTLLRLWHIIEPQAEQFGLYLLRSMFKIDPDLMPKFPFYQDEWNKISYADYQGTYPEQPPNSWFIVFREVFYVQEEMLCVPKLYAPIPTCLLRVINNDDGQEISKVFQKVAPHVYKKNKKGYTFLAEARSTEQAIQAGKWRMRLIGSLSSLPTPVKPDTVNSSFHTREIRDYYVPHDRDVMFRQSINVMEDHLVSLQLQTSKHDVFIKLQILDNEEEMLSDTGKGHVVLPAFVFQKDAEPPNSSRSSGKDSKDPKSAKGNTAKKRTASAASEGKSKQSKQNITGRSTARSSGDEEEDDVIQPKPHKYVLQAQVLRESWPLTEQQWIYVQQLKQLEKEELKVVQKERPPSPAKDTKKETKGKDKGKGKAAKEKDKDKGKDGSRPPSQLFDLTKPNWTLRVVSDGSHFEELEVKKDTERADEIRAMKKAWEDAEPGRAAKALQSRLQYLKSHMVKVEPDHGDEAPKDEPASGEQVTSTDLPPSPTPQGLAEDTDAPVSNIPPPPPPPKEVLKPLDLEPFIRRTGSSPVLRDEEVIQKQLEDKQQEIQAYRSFREEVERNREADRIERNKSKIQQLQLYEQMQAALDTAREVINTPREAFRQKYLEAERKRLEEIAAQEAAMRAEMEKNTPTPKKSAKGKKSASGKKKK